MCELILADPVLGPVQLLKIDISDGFYRVNLNIDDVLKLSVAFPTKPGEPNIVAFSSVLSTGWKNSPPCFQQQPKPSLTWPTIESEVVCPRQHIPLTERQRR